MSASYLAIIDVSFGTITLPLLETVGKIQFFRIVPCVESVKTGAFTICTENPVGMERS